MREIIFLIIPKEKASQLWKEKLRWENDDQVIGGAKNWFYIGANDQCICASLEHLCQGWLTKHKKYSTFKL